MSIDKRMAAKIAGGCVAALAATAISAAPSALADPATPPPPAPDTVNEAAPGPVPHLYNPNNLPPGTFTVSRKLWALVVPPTAITLGASAGDSTVLKTG